MVSQIFGSAFQRCGQDLLVHLGQQFAQANIRYLEEIIEGKHDDIPEQAFYMKGAIEEVLEEAEKMKAGGAA